MNRVAVMCATCIAHCAAIANPWLKPADVMAYLFIGTHAFTLGAIV
jgi:hypothetical protein